MALASAEDLARETVAMEGRVRQLQEEADFAMAQQARAQIALSEARFEQEENAGLRGRLATAEKAREQADARAAEALERLESLRAAQADRDEALRAGTAAPAPKASTAPETAWRTPRRRRRIGPRQRKRPRRASPPPATA